MPWGMLQGQAKLLAQGRPRNMQLITTSRPRRTRRTRTAPVHPSSFIDVSPAESTLSENEEDQPCMGPGRERVFTFRRWHKHRDSNKRYIRHLSTILTSTTWKNLTPPLTGLTVWSLISSTYQYSHGQDLLPAWMPSMQMSDGPLQLTSFALALLLVFRTDTSYARWSESLSIWSAVRNTAKDIIRDAVCWVQDPALLSLLVRWTLTYAHSLKAYVREEEDVEAATQNLLLPHEKAAFCSSGRLHSASYPHYALHVLSQALGCCKLTSNREERMHHLLSLLNDHIGSCEKLLRYPIPLSYTRHTSRFMIIWLSVLPLALWDDVSWFTTPITTTVAFLLLGIEEIGVQIEEPFSQLPVDDILGDIERDLWAITSARNDVKSLIDESISIANAAHIGGMMVNVKTVQQRLNQATGGLVGSGNGSVILSPLQASLVLDGMAQPGFIDPEGSVDPWNDNDEVAPTPQIHKESLMFDSLSLDSLDGDELLALELKGRASLIR